MENPRSGNKYDRALGPWAAENGCFSAGAYFDLDKWLSWLAAVPVEQKRSCLFAPAPDVVGDAAASAIRAIPVLQLIRQLGYKAAFVAQDGLTENTCPWHLFDVLFIGGTTEFKLSQQAWVLTQCAKQQCKWVHMGRVNSRDRLRLAYSWGCNSVDGTKLAFGQDVNIVQLISWLDELRSSPSLISTRHRTSRFSSTGGFFS